MREALASSDSMQDQQKEVSEMQNTVFAGPYANYDIPHLGAAPIPVFRKSCGCIMNLVPQANITQASSGSSTVQGNT